MTDKTTTKRKRTNYDLETTTQKILKCSGSVGSSCFTCGTRRVTVVTNLVISHEWGKNGIVITTNNHSGYYSNCGKMLSLAFLCLSFRIFSFDRCVVCSFSIYGFWLPLWYLKTLLERPWKTLSISRYSHVHPQFDKIWISLGNVCQRLINDIEGN